MELSQLLSDTVSTKIYFVTLTIFIAGLLCWLVAGLPVQQLPVLSTPAVFEFLCVHPSNFFKIRLIDSKQAKTIYLPVTCGKNNKNDKRTIGTTA